MNPAGQAAPPYAPPAYAVMTASQLYAATQLAKEDWSAAITDLCDQASELDRLTGPASAAQLAIESNSAACTPTSSPASLVGCGRARSFQTTIRGNGQVGARPVREESCLCFLKIFE